MNTYFNWNLAQRFVNDYRLPMPIISAEIFDYHLHLYEKEYGTLTKWNKLLNFIDNRYSGDTMNARVEQFLQEFYAVRERVITEIPQKEAFQRFNNMDMSVFPTKRLTPKCSSLYNETNIGKFFISIDLTKGNFQALNYADKGILEADTYDEFISKYTDIYYIAESKYFRQVIFGKMNPSRHITVEKHIIGKVYDLFVREHGESMPLVVYNSDELIFEFTDWPPVNIEGAVAEKVKNELGINVHCEVFSLNGYDFFSERERHKRCTYFEKYRYSYPFGSELMCIPLPYHALIYKLHNGLDFNEKDYHFNYENIDCIFNDNFYIQKIQK